MPDVGRKADLAHLAVADDVHAGCHLLRHDITHGARHGRVEGIFVIVGAAVLREKLIDDVLRARQTADVGGEDALSGFVSCAAIPLRVRPPMLKAAAGHLTED